MKVLLVDDDPRIRTMVREYATAENWQFMEAGNGEEALQILLAHAFDLIVLDVMMPKIDGWTTLRKIRETNTVPVILLTARAEEYDRLLGFELGVDDYVSKPFSPRELVARMKALLKRSGVTATQSQIVVIEGLRVDLTSHQTFIDNKPVALTPKEFDLLAFLMSRPRQVFTRDQLLNHVWGYDYFGDARTVDTHVRSLREKIEPYRHLIATVWGTGYRFEAGDEP
ncbi:MAG: response regulator transcription factor [Eubacteriales bacterium]|nr:response regulator transcription factor [Eubacteriales bacterium]